MDTLDLAQAYFDSSGFGLDADTGWTDNRPMLKLGDTINGYFYYLPEDEGFQYRPNYLFRFRVKGKGSIPPLRDSLVSPLNDIVVLAPQPDDTIRKGENLVVRWVMSGENNIVIVLSDTAGNELFYYPIIDTGRFIIRASALDSLATGPIEFQVGRLNMKVDFFPGFPLYALTVVVEVQYLELVAITGIEEKILAGGKILFNPFFGPVVKYHFSQPSPILLRIYSPDGRQIREIREERKIKGQILWDKRDARGNQVNKGIYLFNLVTDREAYRGKFLIW